MQKIAIFVFALLLSVFLKAQQETGSISGIITDEKGMPLPMTNVLLFAAADTSMVKGEITADDGSYSFSNIPPQTYFIETSFLGYKVFRSPQFELQRGQAFEMASINLEAESEILNEVQITAERPMIEVQPDKTVFNVDGSINATGNTALELLRKSPGVIVDNNDNIILSGKNGVEIYIDGKPSYLGAADLAAQLRAMQSSEIDAIEIITNPSAKYDAEGNAGIINIRLKKDKSLGANMNLTSGYSYGSRSKYNVSTNFNYRNKKSNLFGSASFNDGTHISWMNLYRIQSNTLFDEKTTSSRDGAYISGRIGTDFFLSKERTFGFLVNGYWNDRNWQNNSYTPITDLNSNQLISILDASSQNDGIRKRLNANVNYKFDNGNGKSWSVDADWGVFANDTKSFQPNTYLSEDGNTVVSQRNFRFFTPTNIDIYTIKTDYAQPLGKGTLSAGAKFSWVRTDNTFEYFNIEDGNDVLDMDRSNNFVYDENINAAFISYNATFGKFDIYGGLRGEHTHSNGALSAQRNFDNSNVTRDYFNLFPSGGITYNPNRKNQWRINYSRRIDRPSYQDLNPFEFRLSELSYSRGNPFLQPQYTNSISLAHTYNYRLTTSLTYSHTSDFFANISDSTEVSRTFLETINLDYQRVISLNVSYPFSVTDKWSTYTSVTGYQTQNKADLGQGRIVDLKATVASFYHQSTFKLPRDFSLEVSGWYSSPSIWGAVYKTESIYSLDMGIKKSFANGRANVKLSVTDILNTTPWRGIQEFAGFYVDASGGWESRQIRFNLSYLFGNDQVKKSRKRQIGLEDEAGRVK